MSERIESEFGLIPIDWEIAKFEDVAELRHGYQFRNYDFTEDGIKIVKITQIKGDGHIDISNCSFIDKNRIESFKKFIIEKGDILLALTGATIGKFARYKEDEIVLQNYRVGNFFPLDYNVLSKDYLYYYLSSDFFYFQIIARQTQSAQQNIGKDEINNMSIILPKFEEQKEIAKTLSNLDKKITLLRQQNQDLEELAQILFKRWFVEFEFPNENGEPYKSSGGNMIESELGEIPEGWRVTQLKKLADKISKGTTPRKNEVDGLELDVPFIKVKDITDDGQIKFGDIESIPNSVHNGSLKRSILNRNDILFSIAGTIGRVTIVPEDLNNSNCNQAVAFIRLKEIQHLELIHQWFKSQSVQNEINASIVQGVQANVSLGVLGNLLFNIPNDEFIEKWNAVIKPIYEKCNNCSNEIQTLTQLRDTLLPKLMSGELKVKA
ncbi:MULTISPECIES: restriction endonuclease subunit S [unclassified Carboxylicivirga]|uniref:restriction endonuclease subunit S n=1 Tax=Carboxylicivirga TaxID=1628153 RepID=UPI003D332663